MSDDRDMNDAPSSSVTVPSREPVIEPAMPPAPSRRSVVRGAGALLATGTALAACGEGDSPPASSTGSAATSAAPSGGGVELGPAADVPVGGGMIFADAKVVVSQPEQGTFKAFSTTCTHKQCAVTEIDGDAVVCPCHGSRFSLTDGSPTQGPATAPLEPRQVQESGGALTLG
ncbi:MAG: Rieske (2Fe-2S) protein [Angustibacter sp.]